MDFGSTWPSQVDRTGRRAWTSPPSRYQSSSVETVKTCRRSCSLGARCPGGALMPAAATSTANVLGVLRAVQRPAAAVDEERARLRLGERLVAGPVIGAQGGGRGRVEEHHAGLAELGVRDRDRLRSFRSTSSGRRRQASPWRMPVTASRPISVRQVTARNAGWSVLAAAIRAVTSCGE